MINRRTFLSCLTSTFPLVGGAIGVNDVASAQTEQECSRVLGLAQCQRLFGIDSCIVESSRLKNVSFYASPPPVIQAPQQRQPTFGSGVDGFDAALTTAVIKPLQSL